MPALIDLSTEELKKMREAHARQLAKAYRRKQPGKLTEKQQIIRDILKIKQAKARKKREPLRKFGASLVRTLDIVADTVAETRKPVRKGFKATRRKPVRRRRKR